MTDVFLPSPPALSTKSALFLAWGQLLTYDLSLTADNSSEPFDVPCNDGERGLLRMSLVREGVPGRVVFVVLQQSIISKEEGVSSDTCEFRLRAGGRSHLCLSSLFDISINTQPGTFLRVSGWDASVAEGGASCVARFIHYQSGESGVSIEGSTKRSPSSCTALPRVATIQ